MSYFTESEINFGTIRQGKTKEFIFKAIPTIPQVKDIIASCGCSKPSFNPTTRELKITYKAGNIPKQVQGNQVVNVLISVIYTNGTSEALYIKGIKLR